MPPSTATLLLLFFFLGQEHTASSFLLSPRRPFLALRERSSSSSGATSHARASTAGHDGIGPGELALYTAEGLPLAKSFTFKDNQVTLDLISNLLKSLDEEAKAVLNRFAAWGIDAEPLALIQGLSDYDAALTWFLQLLVHVHVFACA